MKGTDASETKGPRIRAHSGLGDGRARPTIALIHCLDRPEPTR